MQESNSGPGPRRLDLRESLGKATVKVARSLPPLQFPGVPQELALAIGVGVVSGVGAVLFHWLLDFFHTLFYSEAATALERLGDVAIALLPALGGLLVAPLVIFLAPEVRGPGVAHVMTAVATGGGRIRPRVALVRSLASSICIGSGGSVGSEGPIVQIGSSLGSTLGQWVRAPEERLKVLVACGAAGGIAGVFNAPLAGVFFSMEVILRRYSARSFGLVALSAVAATALARLFLGDFRVFDIPPYSLVSAWELPLYALLGLAAAGAAHVFVTLLYRSEDVFNALRAPALLKPALGGLLLGGMGVLYPQVLGIGYETIDQALLGGLPLGLLALLLLLKSIGVCLTLGSGGSGGVFGPCLFLGAMLGGAFGTIVHTLLPDTTAPIGAYTLVGMAAFLAASARSPVTAIVMLFEMTQDYAVILPLMTAVVVSAMAATRLRQDSIYTLRIRRAGVPFDAEEQENAFLSVRVADTMVTDFTSVPPDMSLEHLDALFAQTGHHGFPVVEGENRLVGIVTMTDLRKNGGQDRRCVRDIATEDVLVTYPDETLHGALAHFQGHEVGHIPVVSREDHSRLLGILRRQDILQAYADSLEQPSPPRKPRRGRAAS